MNSIHVVWVLVRDHSNILFANIGGFSPLDSEDSDKPDPMAVRTRVEDLFSWIAPVTPLARWQAFQAFGHGTRSLLRLIVMLPGRASVPRVNSPGRWRTGRWNRKVGKPKILQGLDL